MSKKILTLIILVIILILLAFIVFSVSNSVEQNNLNEVNTNKISLKNNIENNISEESQKIEANNEQTTLNEGSENMNNQNEEVKINLIVNNKTFSATLNNNETTKELISMFPTTLNMNDLHSNEKYNYLDTILPTNSSTPSRINAGDIKLYGNNCLVVFYESFNNSYSYTDLGKIDDIDAFVSELGRGSVSIRFELAGDAQK